MRILLSNDDGILAPGLSALHAAVADLGETVVVAPTWRNTGPSALPLTRAPTNHPGPAGPPYPIPAGASEHPLGGLGFANWAFEVAEQERQLGVTFDTIVVCTVTGSTHAGMIAGFAALEDLTGVRRRVLGIDASATLEKTRDQVARIARHTAELIELGRDLRDDEIDAICRIVNAV